MDADQELPDDQLPQGHTPIWIEPPGGATQVQMLERCEEIVGGRYKDVMVLYDGDDSESPAALSWCGERGWQYHNASIITGCEAYTTSTMFSQAPNNNSQSVSQFSQFSQLLSF